MVKLNKLPANDPDFIKTRKQFETVLKDFENYAERLTAEAGRAKKRSNKAGSYRNYLVRFILLYQELFGDLITQLDSFATLNKFRKIVNLPEFESFNKDTGRFFNATFVCFTSYLSFKNEQSESISDEILNLELSQLSEDQESYFAVAKDNPKPRPDKNLKTNNGNAYPRDLAESLQAKKNSNWCCEISQDHFTFISASNRKPFVEAHHLIPMSAQDDFLISLDFAENIVALCPNCHKMIHHSDFNTRKKSVEYLFNKRKSIYPKYQIEISLEKLFSYYGIE